MATPEIDQLTDQAKELSLHEDSSITINYDDGKDAQVLEIKMLTKLLSDSVRNRPSCLLVSRTTSRSLWALLLFVGPGIISL